MDSVECRYLHCLNGDSVPTKKAHILAKHVPQDNKIRPLTFQKLKRLLDQPNDKFSPTLDDL